MKETDIEHLNWMYGRMRNTHKEERDVDYMIKFASIIDELEKESMPEKKRYRLEFPKDVPKEYMRGYAGLYLFDGKKVDFVCMYDDPEQKIARFRFNGEDYDIPKSWLVEIKEEYYVLGEYPKKHRVECFRDDLKLLDICHSFLKAKAVSEYFDTQGYEGVMIVKSTHKTSQI